MKVCRGFQEIQSSFPKTVVTIGNFDGVHLGHRQIIQAVCERAKADGGTSIIYTFRPHPQRFLNPNIQVPLLNTYDEKIKLLEELGVDVVVEEPFGREFSTITPERFFRDILVKRLNAFAVYVGYDFGFGKDREGSLSLLEKLCLEEGVEFLTFKPLKIGDQVCSSSQIRKYISSGEIREANKLLGRAFFYSGHVVKGNGRGKKLGFATANVHTGSKLWIKEGVYVTTSVLKGKRFRSVTNVGRQPTFNESGDVPVVMETHLLDFNLDIYGETLEVHFIDRLRDEKRFSSLDDLITQIKVDVEYSRNFKN